MSLRLHQAEWPVGDLASRLNECDAVVCTASLLPRTGEQEAPLDLLSAAERVRHASYGNAIVARRYACGRRLVREMLGRALRLHPQDVPVREGLHGKPFLAAGTRDSLWFSISHSDDLLVVAMSRSADVGVDVERRRAFEQWQRVADRVLDPQERAQLERAIARGDDPSDAFLRHWCRVEAELKAIGCGIVGLEAHLAGMRPRGLRLADLGELPIPAALASTGVRYEAAVALCVPGASCTLDADSLLHTAHESSQHMLPTANPARASTP